MNAPSPPLSNAVLRNIDAYWRAANYLAPDPLRGAGRLQGEDIEAVLARAPGNGAPIGGVKVIAKSGRFAARPSSTESIYKIYAESFEGAEHLRRVLGDAQALGGSETRSN